MNESTEIRVTPSYVPEAIKTALIGAVSGIPIGVGAGFYAWLCVGDYDGMVGLGRFDGGPVSHKQLYEAGFYHMTDGDLENYLRDVSGGMADNTDESNEPLFA